MTEPTSPGGQGSSWTTIRDELSNDASRLTQTATSKIEQAADGRKQQVTGAAQAVSSAIDRAVGALREDDQAPDWLTSAFEKTARQIGDLARSVEGKDISEIRRGVTDFARQSPVAFLAASAVAGFAAARVLRAGSEYQTRQEQGGRSPTSDTTGFGSTDSGFASTSGMGAVGAAAGSDLGASGGATGAPGANESVWAPASAPLDSEGALS